MKAEGMKFDFITVKPRERLLEGELISGETYSPCGVGTIGRVGLTSPSRVAVALVMTGIFMYITFYILICMADIGAAAVSCTS